ncbi:uncharacterized protein LOC142495174 isoform X5 [Ascaphus truei]|uniref:uncharacterized protein LOC142495174 isoform X5 n=1 Tax=Ascaphus truei TaxID=8439 RepID=UPI003F599941
MGSGASMGSGANSTVRLVSTNTDLRGVASIGREVRGNALSLVSSSQAWKYGASTHLVESLEKTQDDHYVGVKDVEKNLKEAEEKAKEQENQLAKCEGTILDPTEDAACVEENLNVVEITADDEIPSEETIEAKKQRIRTLEAELKRIKQELSSMLAKCEGTILDPTQDAACVEENLNVVEITADDEIPSEETIEAKNQLAKCEGTILDPTEDAACVEENLNVVEITADDEIPSEETIEATNQLAKCEGTILDPTEDAACVEENLNVVEIPADDKIPSEETIEAKNQLAKCEGTILDPTEDAACVEENLNVVEITADDEIPSEETIEATKQLAQCEGTILDPTEDAACIEENLNVVEITADDEIPSEETIEAKNQRIRTLEAELKRTKQELSFMKLKHKRRIRKTQKQLLDSRKAASLSILELQSQIKNISEGSLPSAEVVSLHGLSGEVSRAHSGQSLIAEMSSQVSHQQETINQLEEILAQRERKITQLEAELQSLEITADQNYQPDTEETGNGQYEEVNVLESDIDFGRLLSPFPSGTLPTTAKEGNASRHLDNVVFQIGGAL